MDPARRLVIANAVLAGAVLLHGIDHSLQSRGVGALTTEVRVGGFVIAALAALSIVLAVRRSPRAAAVAVGVGAWVAFGVTISHFVPHWSAFSDPYMEIDLSAVSWLAAAIEAVAGIALAAVGMSVLRRRTPLA